MFHSSKSGGCQWPMWPHDAAPNHQYCGRRRKENSSYCPEHYQLSIRSGEDEDTAVFVRRKAA